MLSVNSRSGRFRQAPKSQLCGVAMKQKKRNWIVLITLLACIVICARVADALTGDLGVLPPAIESLYNAGSYSQAAEALEAFVAQSPKDTSLYYWLGRCHFELHDFNHAISDWERTVALDPGRSEYHDWLGRAYGRKAEGEGRSKMTSALSLARRTHHEFETAVQLDPKNIDAQRDLISFMADAPAELGGGEQHAMEQIKALSAVDPVEGALALADFYADRKKFEQADTQYQKILASHPNRADAYFEIEDYYLARGDSDHLEQAIQAAAKLAPSDRRLSYYRGVALVLAKKDPAVAEKELRTYIATVPDNSEVPAHSSAYQWLGKLYENEKNPEFAVDAYSTALTLDPQNKAVQQALKRLQKNDKK
jgi:tetratricopeptide (TPR) repeat protein